jgi:hypothetical protein
MTSVHLLLWRRLPERTRQRQGTEYKTDWRNPRKFKSLSKNTPMMVLLQPEVSMGAAYELAQPWTVSEWINTSEPLTLESLRGQVVVLHVFQMLCPGCVSHGIPQAKAIHNAFPSDRLKVIGLHSVFEHHDAMTPAALKAFVYEYRLRFAIGIDQPDSRDPIPLTMRAYGLEGTPTLILIDKGGHIRLNHFGQIDDLRVGAVLGQLLTEPGPAEQGEAPAGRGALAN